MHGNDPCNLTVALEMAAAGLPVFPAKVSFNQKKQRWEKKPHIDGWQQEATTDERTLRYWWSEWPDAVPGIELGRANLIMFDPDRHGGEDGVANFRALVAQHDPLPDHPLTPTAGDGEHHFFTQPNGDPFTNSEGDLKGKGINVRGKGGWAVAPGSLRPDGKRWGATNLAQAYSNKQIPVLPTWLANIIRPPRTSKPEAQARPTGLDEVARVEAALRCIPSDDRTTWLEIGAALHWTGWRAARSIWDAWSLTTPGAYDAGDQEKTWRSFDRPYNGKPKTLASLFHLAQMHGYTERRREPPPDPVEQPPPSNLCAPYVWRDPATLPKRGWLYGKHYIRQHVSASIGEGGVGKSTQGLTEAVVMVTRHPLLGKTPSTDHPLRVWYWNGEDPKPEIELRIAAICQRFNIDGRSLVGKLFIDGRETPICLAAMKQGAVTLNTTLIAAIIDRVRQNAIDVLILDPFVACHNVPENDNVAIDAVIKALGRIAEETNAAIDIVHHSRKPAPGQEALTISDARGASAIVFGVRSGRIFNQMTTTEAEKAGLNPDDRKAYFRVDRTKANMAPAEFALWHHLAPETLPNGEEVAALDPWKFPDIFEGVTTTHMHAVRTKAQEREYRADIRANDWIGYAVIEALKLGRSQKDKTRVKNILKKWFENGVLTKVEKEDPKYRKPREFVVPGDWQE